MVVPFDHTTVSFDAPDVSDDGLTPSPSQIPVPSSADVSSPDGASVVDSTPLADPEAVAAPDLEDRSFVDVPLPDSEESLSSQNFDFVDAPVPASDSSSTGTSLAMYRRAMMGIKYF